MRFRPALVAIVAMALGSSIQAGEPSLQLQTGDHISIIGNTLADRMQHHGWLETYLYYRFPKKELVFRNLGFSGDELTQRIRSQNFGSPDDWLKRTQADVVFAFFGYNESYAGKEGLPKFEKDLANFIKQTLSQKYNGKSAARLVLFSPIAHENLKSPDFSNGVENNKNLELYTAAMARIAKENGAVFVDLFHPTRELYQKVPAPLTINGVHLTEQGDQRVAEIIDQALFGKLEGTLQTEKLDRIRRAVLDKNFYWYNRYRTVDGYNVFGGRSSLNYNGQTNFVVMQREMEVLDAMTANRDKRIWAIASGELPAKKGPEWDDSNTPPFLETQTNRPGPLPGGKHLFLDGTEAIKKMTLGPDLKINLFASEKEFPDLVNPVQMAFDPQGRLWVAVWPTYPHWKPKEDMNDKLLVLEDTDGDGKADKCSVFADKLHCPTGFAFYKKGVILGHTPELMYLEDTDGDGKADVRRFILHGLDTADTHHAANSFALDPGGALYFQEGVFHHTQVETPYGPTVRAKNAAVFRFEPRTSKFDVYMNVPFANPHGHVFDRWGQDLVVDGTGAVPYHAALYTGQTVGPEQRHPGGAITVYKQKTRPCPAIEYLTSRHFPESMQGNLLVANVIGFQGIMRYKIEDDGASFKGIEQDIIVKSSDPNFRPSDLKIAPDGSIYFIDWHNPIIGHMQHHLRDPNRDREHGRVYRVVYEKNPLLKPAKIAGEPLEKLLNLLKEPEDRVRYRARIEIGSHDAKQVVAAVNKWMQTLDTRDKDYEHHMMEALWVHQYVNVVDQALLRRMLRSPDFHARAAATRMLCYWREQVKEPLELLRVQINDSHPRVRLEAVRALSFFPLPKTDRGEGALAVAVELLVHPTDRYLNFTFNETLNTLERRIGSGAINRQNIAVSLVKLLDKKDLDADRKATLIEAVCRNGGAGELQAIWAKALDAKTLSLGLRKHAVVWLADAALTRRVQPAIDAKQVGALIKDAPPSLLPDALKLAAAWKVKEVASEFQKLAQDPKLAQESRFAAIEGLAALGDAGSVKGLRDLASGKHPLAIRFHAAQELAALNLDEGAKAAARALEDPEQNVDPSPLVHSFLNRKNGADKLGEALAKNKIGADTAKRILRAMFLAGRSDAGLANVVSKFAGLDAAPKPPTPAEVKQLVAEVQAKGDAARGELVFRRADLGCMKCHSINKAGGNIGPDLGPLGGSSPVDYIVTSVLDPSAAIKEEYLTKVITTSRGQIITGIVTERNKNLVVLKDATGKLQRIAAAEIDEEFPGKSLMPDGVSRILTRGELLDLLRFVAELGKPGPFAAPTASTIQTWKRYGTVKSAKSLGTRPDAPFAEELIRPAEPVYGQVNGKLPVADLERTGQGRIVYLEGTIQVQESGPIELLLDGPTSTTWWIAQERLEGSGKIGVTLPPGRHRVIARIDAADASANVRAELIRPKGSRARFELVHGD